MTTPINLNRFRKKKQRADKEQQAQENRVIFGRTKADKRIAEKQHAELDSHLDGHKLDKGKPSP